MVLFPFLFVADPRVKDFFFMSNPFYMLGTIILYLYFVLKWGPKFMENRKPFNLDKIMVVYNVIQIIACLYLVNQVNNKFFHLTVLLQIIFFFYNI